MRILFSYIRLILASWILLGGLALQFIPSSAAVERDVRQRERLIQTVPIEERSEWLRLRDRDDSSSEANLRVFGVLLGGIGLAAALFETAYVSARSSRHCPLDAP
jgi:hypothetical protein